MEIPFYKYQGTGNDFVMIDNRQQTFPKNDNKLIALICDRKFGIGADGLILIENHDTEDFTMVYYNADGVLGSMCGNGGRCSVAFAKYLSIINNTAIFEAVDGMHEASINDGVVSLKMSDVSNIEVYSDYVFLDTGSPHHVQLVENLETFDVFSEGKKIRNSIYGAEGSNVNFVVQSETDTFSVRTFERGVENETLSCGTGVTAVALAMHKIGKTISQHITLLAEGGQLRVRFLKEENRFTNIYLEGSAEQVFKGIWK